MSSKHFIRRPSSSAAAHAYRQPKPFSPVDTATASDIEELLLFLQIVRSDIRGDDDLIADIARELAARHGGVAFVVRGPRDTIEASLGVRFERPLLSRNYYLRSVWNNVIPAARDTGHARSLLLAARNFADRIGRPLYVEEHVSTCDVLRTHIEIHDSKARLCARNITLSAALFVHVPAVTV